MELPRDFEKRMRLTLGPQWESFHQSLQAAPTVSIRVNPRKKISLSETTPVPWCKTGHYLAERPQFTLDPHLHAGAYYVQEASSMFLERAAETLELANPLRVLDLCAAPGGKSTHLLSLLNEKSLLVSNEVIRSRASILSENIQKWGHANVVITNSDPQDFQRLPNFFDVVLVDAPCSGEGLFRKEPSAVKEWSEENANLCSLRQRRILSDVWPALKEGGVLIYSTCTYNPEENEVNLSWLKENQNIEFIELPNIPAGIEKIVHKGAVGYRLLPGKINGEGFFLSIVRKLSSVSEESRPKSKSTFGKTSVKEGKAWVPDDFRLINQNGLVIGWPEELTDAIEMLTQAVTVISKGIAIATVKQNKLIPEHALALYYGAIKSEFSIIDLSLDQALTYLRKETLTLPGHEKGFAVVQFEGNPIGWINHLGNRVNNLYPLNWRIKMGPGGPT